MATNSSKCQLGLLRLFVLYEGLDFAQTGLDEFATVLAFGQYIVGGQTPGGYWAGWEFAFRECPQ